MADNVIPQAQVVKPCRFCQVPVEQPTRRGAVKDFCSDRHRAAFRDAQIQLAFTKSLEAMAGAAAELERLSATLEGAMTLLARYQRGEPRSKKKKNSA